MTIKEFLKDKAEDISFFISQASRLTAITTAMYSDLAEAIGQAAFDDAVRARRRAVHGTLHPQQVAGGGGDARGEPGHRGGRPLPRLP